MAPPLPEQASPWRNCGLDDLILSIAELHCSAAPVSAFAGPALALLERRLDRLQEALLRQAADELRADLVGEEVTYVVNRNLNTSNHCTLHCGFCAFRRDAGQEGAYRLALPVLLERAAEARSLGATEICLQAALDPQARRHGSAVAFAEHLLQELQRAAPGIHLHAFSPQELHYFARSDGLPLETVLRRLRQAGLGSVPGTAAEVLSESVRRRLCPEKLTAQEWVAVFRQVHRLGIASTATLMAGHIEQPADRVAHLLTLLALQRRARATGEPGFSEFVLLPFVGAAAPEPLRQRVGRDQPDAAAMLRLTAQARLLLGPAFPHHQPSWVKLTLPVAAEALRWGCDDLGGTLMEEHITTMAGARGGTAQTPAALEAAAASVGRPVRQRTTLYGRPEQMAA
ncbi:MAG: CofH family radical SAM protein [Cyanobium sp.]